MPDDIGPVASGRRSAADIRRRFSVVAAQNKTRYMRAGSEVGALRGTSELFPRPGIDRPAGGFLYATEPVRGRRWRSDSQRCPCATSWR